MVSAPSLSEGTLPNHLQAWKVIRKSSRTKHYSASTWAPLGRWHPSCLWLFIYENRGSVVPKHAPLNDSHMVLPCLTMDYLVPCKPPAFPFRSLSPR